MSQSKPVGTAPAVPSVRAFWLFFLANYAGLVLLLGRNAGSRALDRVSTELFAAGVILTYPALYLLAVLVPLLLLRLATSKLLYPRVAPSARRLARWGESAFAVLLASAVVLLVIADLRTFEIFGFHVNGFVWNLVTTPGGIRSMGAGLDTVLSVVGLALAVLAVEGLLLAALSGRRERGRAAHALSSRAVVVGFAGLLALISLSERLAYGWSDLTAFHPILRQAGSIPLYQPLRFKGVAKSLGFEPRRRLRLAIDASQSDLDYPLRPIEGGAPHARYNIVWLCAESLRADVLDAEIMPATFALAQRSTWLRQHVSGGNGTRMGVFSMFYGLPGSYWFAFLAESRGPVLVDVLLDEHYQLGIFTSDDFSYPEFDRTVFARVPREELHELGDSTPSWQRDREHVRQLLRFIETRDPDRPFFTFSFLESPHSRYDFPPESVIREPYLESLNYVSMDLQRDIGLIWNRYVNSVHHLDSQIARVLDYLESEGLLEKTIVIVTGDHGEEFMEKGRWGHGSAFTEEQVRVPLVISVPGRAPQIVDRLTSHLDLAPTLLHLLGVVTPPEAYATGLDLFGEGRRRYAVVSDWGTVGYLDDELKIRFPTQTARGLESQVSTRSDAEVADPDAQVTARAPVLARMLSDLGRFRKHSGG